MDGVCDSQASVAEAKELIANIDEVLDAGGFHIKEWVSNAPLTDKESRDEVVLGANKETNVQPMCKRFSERFGIQSKISSRLQ